MTFSQDDEMSVDHSELTRDSSTWDLLIKNVKPHHAGVYECQVTANQLIAQYVTLNVIGKQTTSRVNYLHQINQCCFFSVNVTNSGQVPRNIKTNPKYMPISLSTLYASSHGLIMLDNLMLDSHPV